MDMQQEWLTLSSLPIRERVKKLKQIAHEIWQLNKKNEVLPEDIDLYLTILKEAIRFDPSHSLTRSKLIFKKLELSGSLDAEIITKKNGVIGIESGMFAIGDPTVNTEEKYKDYTEKEFELFSKTGERMYVSTGGDGQIDVQLRVVKAKEPVLTPKEYKLVSESTETVVLHIPSGTVSVADLGMVANPEQSVRITITPGDYKTCVYSFDTKKDYFAYYIVLCKTASPTTHIR